MNRVPFLLGAFAVAATLLAAPASAENTVRAGDLVIEAAWSRATPPTAKVAAGYLTIRNEGAAADRLIGGEADFAGRVEIHTMTMSDGVMRMRALEDGLEIPPGGEVTLRPGAEHVMFLALGAPLGEGESRDVALTFERAGVVRVVFAVEAAGATGPSAR